MIEKPFVVLAGIASKVQTVATQVAESSAKVAQSIASKVQSIASKVQSVATKVAESAARSAARMANTAAKIQARAAMRQTARAAKAMQKRPSVQFLRELTHGQTSVSFYRTTTRAGVVRDYWTLNRATNRGRVRLATGTMAEFHNLRAIGSQAVRQQIRARQQATQLQAPRQQAQQGQKTELARRDGQEFQEVQRRGPEPREARQSNDRDHRSRKDYFTVIYVEGLNKDGSARARVIRSFDSLSKARTVQAGHPGLAVHRHAFSSPPRQGEVLKVHAGDSPEVAARMKELGQKARGPSRVFGLSRAALAHGQTATPELKQKLRHSRGL